MMGFFQICWVVYYIFFSAIFCSTIFLFLNWKICFWFSYEKHCCWEFQGTNIWALLHLKNHFCGWTCHRNLKCPYLLNKINMHAQIDYTKCEYKIKKTSSDEQFFVLHIIIIMFGIFLHIFSDIPLLLSNTCKNMSTLNEF